MEVETPPDIACPTWERLLALQSGDGFYGQLKVLFDTAAHLAKIHTFRALLAGCVTCINPMENRCGLPAIEADIIVEI